VNIKTVVFLGVTSLILLRKWIQQVALKHLKPATRLYSVRFQRTALLICGPNWGGEKNKKQRAYKILEE